MSTQTDLKLVLLGHKNVGKTSIFNRYIYDEFTKTSMTIGAYFGVKQVLVNNKMHNFAIWDTAGEEKFDSLTSFYCRNARAALVCYDVTSQESFASLPRWVKKIETEADPDCSIIIVGNKYDMVDANPAARRVDVNEAKRYAASIKADYIEVSAKSGLNVSKAFLKVVGNCLEKNSANNNQTNKTKGSVLDEDPSSATTKKGCC